jgi:hypothetical protein
MAMLIAIVAIGVGVAVVRRAPTVSEDTPSALPRDMEATAPVVGEPAKPVVVEVEPPAPLSGEFELQHRRPSSGTTFYAIGWITNTSSVAIERPKITAVLLDDKGAEVGTAFGFAEGDAIEPGARAPVKILVQDPPAFATITFEFDLRPPSYIPRHVAGLRLEQAPAKVDMFGTKIAGKVFNDGSEPARFVHIQALTFATDGKLIGIDDTYADADVLAPGASSRFEVNLMSSETRAAKYELTVTGSPVD